MFKSLDNVKRIASISKKIEEKLNLLSWNNVSKEVVTKILYDIKKQHGQAVFNAIIEEVKIEPKTEMELFRLRTIISVAKGFLWIRESKKNKLLKLQQELYKLDKAIPVSLYINMPYGTFYQFNNYYVNKKDFEKLVNIKKRIKNLKDKIIRIKQEYFL